MRVRSCGPLFARSSGMFFSPRSKFNATSFAEFHLMGRRGTFPNIVAGFEFRDETDTQSLQAAWKATLKVKCPHCSEVHQISVRETYINGATGCYRQPVGHLGQVAWVGY